MASQKFKIAEIDSKSEEAVSEAEENEFDEDDIGKNNLGPSFSVYDRDLNNKNDYDFLDSL